MIHETQGFLLTMTLSTCSVAKPGVSVSQIGLVGLAVMGQVRLGSSLL